MRLRHLATATLSAALCLPAVGQELQMSGFGTIGWAQSNRDYAYLRKIDKGGTFERDTVVGLQGDLRFNPQWSATVQLKGGLSSRSDDSWTVRPTWAFVAWRPNDNWLLRAGRLRVPFYLHSESLDVGVTHDWARLPVEMYSFAPTTDFDGLYATRTWSLKDTSEIALDFYAGSITTTPRFWYRDGLPPLVPAGAQFRDIDVSSGGAVLTFRAADSLWRAGVHRTSTHPHNGSPLTASYPFVPVAPGVGYYKTVDQLPGPDIPKVDSITNHVFVLGFEQQFATHWRVAAEYGRTIQRDTVVGADLRGGYVALFRSFGHFTPYVSLGAIGATDGAMNWYQQLTENPLPAAIPGAAQINALQRIAAESTYVLSQRSIALGGSYSIDSKQKVKFEWLHSRVGKASWLVDTPAGQPTIRDTNVDVISVNYNFTF